MENNREEIVQIVTEFAESGWDLIALPSKTWLENKGNSSELIAAIEQADKECGNCGCEYDALYKKALEMKELL